MAAAQGAVDFSEVAFIFRLLLMIYLFVILFVKYTALAEKTLILAIFGDFQMRSDRIGP